MATLDRRAQARTYRGGSSLLDVGLTAVQAQAALNDDDATAAWVVLAELQGGEMGENAQPQEIKNEAGEIVLIYSEQNEFEIGSTSLSTDDVTLGLLEYLADENTGFFKMRYPLPAGVDAEGNPLYQLWCFPHAKVVRQQYRMPLQEGQARVRPFVVKAYKRGGEPVYYRSTVRLDSQGNWPEALDPFKDTAYGAT